MRGKLKTSKLRGSLHSAGEWVKTYDGKSIVQGYSKRYGVDLLCAIKELRLVGVEVKEEYEIAVKRSIAARTLQKNKRKEQLEKQEDPLYGYTDETFAFIAGYTSGGAAYGMTWAEMEAENTNSIYPNEIIEGQGFDDEDFGLQPDFGLE